MSTCYYPNGNEVSGEKVIPCGKGDGVACCPETWTCQDNGLCYLPAQKYYGRYSCTDKSWQSDGCPQICTQDNTAVGNEAVLECSSNNWCCDANRPELDGGTACCDKNSPRFSLDSSKKQKPIGGSSNSGSNSNDDSDSNSSSDTAKGKPSSTSSPTAARTSLITSVATSNGNSVSTIIITSQVTSAPSTSTPSSSTSGTPIAAIIAPAVIVPLFLLSLAGLLFFFLLRRRRRRRNTHINNGGPTGAGALPMYKEEISPISPYSNQSELEGSSPNLAATMQRSKSGRPQYETPGDIRQSTLSQVEVPGARESDPVELPAQEVKKQEQQQSAGKTGLGIQNSGAGGGAGDGRDGEK